MTNIPNASQPGLATGTVTATDPVQAVKQVREAYAALKQQIHNVIVGQDDVIDQMLISVFCRGHCLVEGVPGLAKTLLISTIARTLNLQFSRIQFTPDLMPSDITGTEVIEEDKTSGQRRLRFVQGPVFANIILADEINRTPPKTQSALLEAMQEHQVTAGGRQHRLPQPFFVLATQNPIEQEGTYPLPEAQLDRFMLMIRINYPTMEQEMEVVRRTTTLHEPEVKPVLTGADVLRIQQLLRDVPVADHILQYALALVRATRVKDETVKKPKVVTDYLSWGAGPRAGQFLVLAAKARAILSGATHVAAEHIRSVAHPVLRHRIVTNFNAEADGVTTDNVIDQLLKEIPLHSTDPDTARKMETVMR